ncbi:hypothetical protein OF83DRAFT_1167731 [Amylostereum chailletii]|nr:hypothetical protein OF83DRAFT_1167731 [Amylostereum chailletii]
MSDHIEMDELTPRRPQTSANTQRPPSASPGEPHDPDATAANWCWAATITLSFWSFVLIFCPRILLFAAAEGQTLTPLEAFLALHFGLFLAGLAAALVFNMPAVHIVPSLNQNSPGTHPLLLPLTCVALLSAFLSYNAADVGGLSFLFSLGTGMIGVWGLWVIAFGRSSYISKKTGADKHTSAFIFGNKISPASTGAFDVLALFELARPAWPRRDGLPGPESSGEESDEPA